MIQEYLLPEIGDMNKENACFQQDGATAYTTRESMNMLEAIVIQGLIYRLGDVSWPPRSPDLSVPDFSSLRYLKKKIHRN